MDWSQRAASRVAKKLWLTRNKNVGLLGIDNRAGACRVYALMLDINAHHVHLTNN